MTTGYKDIPVVFTPFDAQDLQSSIPSPLDILELRYVYNLYLCSKGHTYIARKELKVNVGP